MSRIVVEWVKEANVNFIVGDLVGLDEKPRWEKCKLRRVKASGGFLLEFFVPPKVGFGIFFKVAICWIFYALSSCHISYMQSKFTVYQYVSHINCYCVHKSQEEG